MNRTLHGADNHPSAGADTMVREFVLRIGFWCILAGIAAVGCAYRLEMGPFEPSGDLEQVSGMGVSDDGTVTFIQDRLEIALRPMTDEELNRQFAEASKGEKHSTNPYTFGDWRPSREEKAPQRFAVFRLKVKNYAYPKIEVDPLKTRIVSGNGRAYNALDLLTLKEYYYPFVIGYAGNAYIKFEERKDILTRTMYAGGLVFSGQEQEGYVVFPKIHEDVRTITVFLEGIVLRFDSSNLPIEQLDLEFRFHRDIHRRDEELTFKRSEVRQ